MMQDSQIRSKGKSHYMKVRELTLGLGTDHFDIQGDSQNPLQDAINSGEFGPIIEQLHQIRNEDLLKIDRLGNSALHNAILRDMFFVSLSLIAQGTPVNLQNAEGDTPLHLASRAGNWNLIRLLLANGADKHILNHKAQSPSSFVEEILDLFEETTSTIPESEAPHTGNLVQQTHITFQKTVGEFRRGKKCFFFFLNGSQEINGECHVIKSGQEIPEGVYSLVLSFQIDGIEVHNQTINWLEGKAVSGTDEKIGLFTVKTEVGINKKISFDALLLHGNKLIVEVYGQMIPFRTK